MAQVLDHWHLFKSRVVNDDFRAIRLGRSSRTNRAREPQRKERLNSMADKMQSRGRQCLVMIRWDDFAGTMLIRTQVFQPIFTGLIRDRVGVVRQSHGLGLI